MFLCGVVSLFAVIAAKFLFGIIAENITINIRAKLYGTILQKHMGWFDEKENSAGVLVSVLASDVATLNGASSEAIGIMAEVTFSLLCGIIMGFYFFW
jgi:ATP-binding cassette subfamily B (MDR/TAP) protein 1